MTSKRKKVVIGRRRTSSKTKAQLLEELYEAECRENSALETYIALQEKSDYLQEENKELGKKVEWLNTQLTKVNNDYLRVSEEKLDLKEKLEEDLKHQEEFLDMACRKLGRLIALNDMAVMPREDFETHIRLAKKYDVPLRTGFLSSTPLGSGSMRIPSGSSEWWVAKIERDSEDYRKKVLGEFPTHPVNEEDEVHPINLKDK